MFQQKMTDVSQKLVNIINQNTAICQTEPCTNGALAIDDLPNIAAEVMKPFSPPSITMYVSYIKQNSVPVSPGSVISNPADVMWQKVPTGQSGGSPSNLSLITTGSTVQPCDTAQATADPVTGVSTCPTKIMNLPNHVLLPLNPNISPTGILTKDSEMVLVEIFMQYTPMLNIPGISNSKGGTGQSENTGVVYNFAFGTPRLYGAFECFPTPPSGAPCP